MYKFKAQYDSLSKVYRLVFILFWLIVGFFFLGLVLTDREMIVIMVAYLLTVLYLIYAFSPLGYEIKDDSVIILRKIKPRIIELKKIKDVKRGQEGYELFSEQHGGIRLPRFWEIRLVNILVNTLSVFLAGYTTKKYRDLKSYATSLKNAVVIFADRTYLISPDKPDLFVQLLQERINKR